MHQTKLLLDTTTSRKVYKAVYKQYICKKNGKCTRCKWHSGENAGVKK